MGDPSKQGLQDRSGEIVQEEYRLVQPLGSGELGSIYLADGLKHRERQRFALLMLREKLDAFDADFKAVLGDLKRARTLTDTQLVPIESVVASDGTPGFVSQIVPGRRLDKRLREGPITVVEAFNIATGLGRSLVAAHNQHFIHGDLRPANVLRVHREEKSRYAGRAVLLWHSLYRLRSRVTVDSSADWLMYRPRQDLIGEGRQASADTDTFALGAILYECLSGEPAFGGDFEEMVLENLSRPPPPLPARPETGLSAEIAARIDAVLAVVCAPEQERRMPTMAALVQALEELRNGFPGEAMPVPRSTMVPVPRMTLSAWSNVLREATPATPEADDAGDAGEPDGAAAPRPAVAPAPAAAPVAAKAEAPVRRPPPAVAPPSLEAPAPLEPPSGAAPEPLNRLGTWVHANRDERLRPTRISPPAPEPGPEPRPTPRSEPRPTLRTQAPERVTAPSLTNPEQGPRSRRAELVAGAVGAALTLLIGLLVSWLRSR